MTEENVDSSRAKALAAGAAVAGVEGVSYAALERYGTGLDSMPSVVREEFPGIDRDLLEKFSSFDPELGWCPQPNQTKKKDTADHLPGEEVRNVVTYSTDEYGSRVCPSADRDRDTDGPTVSTYGDSYCFCREVDDEETFQNYLAQRLGTHVRNYGGGNYGMDQALMRIKRRYPEDQTDYVVMFIAAASIARILSVWKHYQEFGNVLAVKPRYALDDGELTRIDTPIEEKEDLLDLASHADFLRSNDYHYEHWFEPHQVDFPYTTDFLANSDQVEYALYAALAELETEYDVSVPGLDPGARLADKTLELEQQRVEYHDRLFDEHDDLFSAIVGEFVSYADDQGFTPVLTMSQQLRYVRYELEHGPIYGDILERLDEQYPDLVTIDVGQAIRESDDVEDVKSLYVQRGEGGHYSPETNESIAEVLHDQLFG